MNLLVSEEVASIKKGCKIFERRSDEQNSTMKYFKELLARNELDQIERTVSKQASEQHR